MYSNQVLDFLDRGSIDVVMADATFSMCPKFFMQLLVIHTVHEEKTLPMIHILMSSKKKSLYINVLKNVRNAIPGFKPSTVVTDFEVKSRTPYTRLVILI
jgi:hypothetical protein